MMAESLGIKSATYDPADTDTYVNNSDQILTKESNSLWDEEW